MYIYNLKELETVNFAEFAEKFGFSGDIVLKYVIYELITSENIFSLSCERGLMKEDSGLYRIACHETAELLEEYREYEGKEFFKDYTPLIPCKEDITEEFLGFKSPEDLTCRLAEFYSKRGCGELSLYRGFRLNREGKVVPVKGFDPITFESLFCYKYQFEELKANTLAFLSGKPARNALLTGARGTGKSSSVKALINMYKDRGLRLIEVSKDKLHFLPELMPKLSERGFKFIIFIDDLSFEADDSSYKYLKSVLEGSAEAKPSNVIFYVTSNRRHIIAEKWEDRGDMSQRGEIHTMDQLNEKVSLSDRFGLKLTFLRPSPKEYIEIVRGIAAEKGIEADENLIKAANAYELSAGGRSGRTAKHFMDAWLCGGELN
ncbi:MAG: ATP-binding protein [Clostridiales bacterium]|nr:ATP-binding protein [Clostridiales bacterium]